MSLLRYAGGKSKLTKPILQKLKEAAIHPVAEYREPFLGGGSVAIKLLEDGRFRPESVWLNDRDPGIAALWTAVARRPEELKSLVMDFTPSIEAFDAYKDDLLSMDGHVRKPDSIVEAGFKKLALNRMSYSGLGVMAAGPMGGREQRSEYKIDSRWSADRLCNEIDLCNRLLNSVELVHGRCTCLDFETVIQDDGEPALLYLDPPYFEKGGQLYQHAFNVEDHERLARLLRDTQHRWVLSYDNCEEIRDLYAGWARIDEVSATYSVNGGRRTSELLISPRAASAGRLCLSSPASRGGVGVPTHSAMAG